MGNPGLVHRFELRKGEKPPIEVYIGLSNFLSRICRHSRNFAGWSTGAAVQGRVEAGLKPVGADNDFRNQNPAEWAVFHDKSLYGADVSIDSQADTW